MGGHANIKESPCSEILNDCLLICQSSCDSLRKNKNNPVNWPEQTTGLKWSRTENLPPGISHILRAWLRLLLFFQLCLKNQCIPTSCVYSITRHGGPFQQGFLVRTPPLIAVWRTGWETPALFKPFQVWYWFPQQIRVSPLILLKVKILLKEMEANGSKTSAVNLSHKLLVLLQGCS